MATMIWERTGMRMPGVIEVSWNRVGFSVSLIFDPEPDYGLPWMLHLHLLFLNLFLHFPAPRISHDPEKYGDWMTYGFSFLDDAVHFNWGYKCKVKYWPWSYKYHRHEVLRANGEWVSYIGCWEHDKEPDGRKVENFGYAYILRNGEVQHRIASVYVDRMTWRQRWLYWTPWHEKTRQSISVEFNDEVGERTGSWKGGTIGCGYEMKPRETPERCLRRMEQERKFD